jgi:hypothetical protein
MPEGRALVACFRQATASSRQISARARAERPVVKGLRSPLLPFEAVAQAERSCGG